jgi:hypothetical protein
MKNMLNRLTDAFSKKSLPNPDINHNMQLLKEASGLIESGAISHYFRKSFLVMMEVVSYSFTVFLFVAGVILLVKVNSLFNVLTNSALILELLSEKDIDASSLNFIRMGIYMLLFIPFLISIFWSRVYTKSRRRISLIRRVEFIIKQVVTNLEAAAKKIELG